MFTLITAIWQHTAAVAAASVIESICYNSVKATVGNAAVAQAWITVALLMIVTIGMVVMLVAIAVLDRLTDG